MATSPDYFELTIRAGEDFKLVITVNQSGAPLNLSGWTSLTSEGKLTENGPTLFTATVAFTTDGIDGQLDYEIAEADTGALQTAGDEGGVVDIFGTDDSAPTRVRRIAKGRWILDKSATFP